MVDKLKRSLEHLDPPNCPNCAIEMKWSRSALVDAATIRHVFVCPGCSHIAESKSTIGETAIPPEKLSAPRSRHAA